MTTKTITAFVDHPSEWHTTVTVAPVGELTEAASLLISQSISTKIDKTTAVRITITTESPYLFEKNTQIAEFPVVNPEQSKFIRPVNKAILSMNPECDLSLTTYLGELFKTNKTEPQSFIFRFQHPKILAKLRITIRYRHGSLKICVNYRKKN